jgi:cell division protein FtsL
MSLHATIRAALQAVFHQSDLLLTGLIAVACLGLLGQILPVIRMRVDIYQQGYRIVQLDETRNQLLAEQERLHVELEYRRSQVDVQQWAAENLGMKQVEEEQILVVRTLP